MLVLGG